MAFESSIRPQRLGFIRETVTGATPTNPAWKAYSKVVETNTATLEAPISERRSVGSPDVHEFTAGSENHQFEVTYDMYNWFESAPGTPLDASYDGTMRAVNGELPASHSILQRNILGGGGTLGGGVRGYVVATGAKIGNVSISGEPESGDPIKVSLTYMAEKMRYYTINQPVSATALTIVSTSAEDTTQTITIENDAAAASEVVNINGITPVTTSATFATIDAAYLSAQCVGDIVVKVGANEVLRIYGKASYQNREGDRGIPLLGSGSHPGAVSGSPLFFLGNKIERDGDPMLDNVEISSVELTIDNNLDPQPSHKTIGRRINEGDRSVTLSATVYGNTASYNSTIEHLRVVQSDIEWELSAGTIELPGATLTSPGAVAHETSTATMSIDNTFTSKGVDIVTPVP